MYLQKHHHLSTKRCARVELSPKLAAEPTEATIQATPQHSGLFLLVFIARRCEPLLVALCFRVSLAAIATFTTPATTAATTAATDASLGSGSGREKRCASGAELERTRGIANPHNEAAHQPHDVMSLVRGCTQQGVRKRVLKGGHLLVRRESLGSRGGGDDFKRCDSKASVGVCHGHA